MEKHHSESPGIWERISSLMLRQKITAKKLAEIAGVVPSAVMKWKAGGRIGSDKIVKISNHFGVSAEWILTGTGNNLPLNGRFQKGQTAATPEANPQPDPGAALTPEVCRIPAGCDLPGQLAEVMKQLVAMQAEMNELRKAFVSLLAEEREKNHPSAPPGCEMKGEEKKEKAG